MRCLNASGAARSVREPFAGVGVYKEIAMLERIIARGIVGPELAALSAGALCGIQTGGHTHRSLGPRSLRVVQRYALSADSTSLWAAMWRNVREAEGTLIVGEIGRELSARFEAEGRPVFPATHFFPNSAKWLAGWVACHRIRTLNVVAPSFPRLAGETCELLVAMLSHFDKPARRPRAKRTYVFADGRALYAVSLWPAPRAWRWEAVLGRWQRVADLQSIERLRLGRAARLDELWNSLPEHIRQHVVGADETALDILAACNELGKAVDDLARSGRGALLRLVAQSYAVQGPGAAPSLRRLLQTRLRDILGGFGFPATESAVRILAKLSPGASNLAAINTLRDLLCSDVAAVKLLRQLPRINMPVIHVLADPWLRRVISQRCLWEISRESDDAPAIVFALEALYEAADRASQRNNIGMIHSLRRLNEVLLRLFDMPDGDWPTPPAELAGVPGLIEPLTTPAEVAEEGMVMRHCVRSRTRAMLAGNRLLFRIVADPRHGIDRATLELRPSREGQWVVAQLFGSRNAAVSAKTRTLVDSWREFAHRQCDSQRNRSMPSN
jgi:hypothetical protein